MQGTTVEQYAVEVLTKLSKKLVGKGYGPDQVRSMLARLSVPAGRGMIETGYDEGLDIDEVAGQLMAVLVKG